MSNIEAPTFDPFVEPLAEGELRQWLIDHPNMDLYDDPDMLARFTFHSVWREFVAEASLTSDTRMTGRRELELALFSAVMRVRGDWLYHQERHVLAEASKILDWIANEDEA